MITKIDAKKYTRYMGFSNGEELLNELEDPSYTENFKRNLALMDLREIPSIITENILSALKDVDETVAFNAI